MGASASDDDTVSDAEAATGDEVWVALDEARGLRLRVARLDGAVRELVARHRASTLASHALARAALVAALYPTSFKDLARVSLQWSGAGPVGTVMAELRAPGLLRATVKRPDAVVDGLDVHAAHAALGIAPHGTLTVLRQGPDGHVATGQSVIKVGGIDDDAQDYFQESEQVPTVVAARFDDVRGRAFGVLVQRLPDGDEDALPDAATLVEAVRAARDLDDVLARALPGAAITVLERRPITLRCTCDRGRIVAAIRLVEPDVLRRMIDEDGGAHVTCDFCRADYTVTVDELRAILAEHGA